MTTDQETVRSEEDYGNDMAMPHLPEESAVHGVLAGKPRGFGLAVPVGDTGVSPLAEDSVDSAEYGGPMDQSNGENSLAESITPTPGATGSKFFWAGIALLFVTAAVIATAAACATGNCSSSSSEPEAVSSNAALATPVPSGLSFFGEDTPTAAPISDFSGNSAGDRSTDDLHPESSKIPSTGGIHPFRQLLL